MPDIGSVVRDPAREDEGEEKELTLIPGAFITLRSVNYPPYKNEVANRTFKARRRQNATVQQDVIYVAAAKHLIVGWRDDWVIGGKPFPHTSQNALTLMTDRKYADVANDILGLCGEVGIVEQEAAEEDEKN